MKLRRLMTSGWSTRAVRRLALVLVGLGWTPGGPRAAAPEPPTPDTCTPPGARVATVKGARPAAPAIAADTIAALRPGLLSATLLEGHVGRGRWPNLRARLVLGGPPEPARSDAPLEQHIARHLAEPSATTPARARALLEAARAELHPDVALSAWAFHIARATATRGDLDAATRDALAALFAEASLHARLHTAIIETLAETGPVTFRAWMSKAAPRPDQTGIQAPDDFWPTFEKKAPYARAGTWDDPVITLELVSGATGARLHAWGKVSPLGREQLQLARLDLVTAGDSPLVLKHTTLGVVTLPARATLTALNLAAFTTPLARTSVDELVQRATRCDRTALATLETLMPAADGAVRDALAAPADAEATTPDGRPALRMLLTLFDE